MRTREDCPEAIVDLIQAVVFTTEDMADVHANVT
jgi:hypothetical protein